jgi:hypothetical protein
VGARSIYYGPVHLLNVRSIHPLVPTRKIFVEGCYKTLKGKGRLVGELVRGVTGLQALSILLPRAVKSLLAEVMQHHCYFLLLPFLLIAEAARPD